MNNAANVFFVENDVPGGVPINNIESTDYIGTVVSVKGSRAVAVLEDSDAESGISDSTRIEIGSLVAIPLNTCIVIGIVQSMTRPLPGQEDEILPQKSLIEIGLAGEIQRSETTKQPVFGRGVARFPSIGDAVRPANRVELASVYCKPDAATIDVGTLYQDASVPAHLLVDELFGRHFIVVGTTGTGKSSAMTCILRTLLEGHAYGHIVLLDIHNEYGEAFGANAQTIHPNSLRLPFWLLNFQELCSAFIGNETGRDAEVEILSDALLFAKRRHFESRNSLVRRAVESAGISADTPSPFRLSDVVGYLQEQLGKLERAHGALPYRRLKVRIESLVANPRFSFMFDNVLVEDTMADVLGCIFCIPNEGKSVTILDLAPVPDEILDIVISLISRLALELAVWSEGSLPILIVCEEAHRYAPATASDVFSPTRFALARIAKEGRKYGVSLALVTQRPSELDPTIISQCNTAIVMRLATDRDQEIMRSTTHDSAFNLLEYLPVLGDREALVLGQAVAVPMRIKFHKIEDRFGPVVHGAAISTSWRTPNMDRETLETVVSRWRNMNCSAEQSDTDNAKLRRINVRKNN